MNEVTYNLHFKAPMKIFTVAVSCDICNVPEYIVLKVLDDLNVAVTDTSTELNAI